MLYFLDRPPQCCLFFSPSSRRHFSDLLTTAPRISMQQQSSRSANHDVTTSSVAWTTRTPSKINASLYNQYTDPCQCSRRHRWLANRTGAPVAQTGSWSSLSDSHKAAWTALGYTADSWEGKGGSTPPRWKKWKELNLEEQAAAKYGLQVTDANEWEALKPPWQSSAATSSSSTSGNSNSNALALVQDQETRLARQRQGNSGVAGTLGKFAYQAAKGLAPIVGPLLRATGRQGLARGGGRGGGSAAGMAVVGSLLENLPAMVDAAGGKLDVTGIDTLVYLDDSGSMQGNNLHRDGPRCKVWRVVSKRNQLETTNDFYRLALSNLVVTLRSSTRPKKNGASRWSTLLGTGRRVERTCGR